MGQKPSPAVELAKVMKQEVLVLKRARHCAGLQHKLCIFPFLQACTVCPWLNTQSLATVERSCLDTKGNRSFATRQNGHFSLSRLSLMTLECAVCSYAPEKGVLSQKSHCSTSGSLSQVIITSVDEGEIKFKTYEGNEGNSMSGKDFFNACSLQTEGILLTSCSNLDQTLRSPASPIYLHHWLNVCPGLV